MRLLSFSLQRLAGLQVVAASEGAAIKRYHWSALLRIGVFALFLNTNTALATMSHPPAHPKCRIFSLRFISLFSQPLSV
jgi:hypothetical protein